MLHTNAQSRCNKKLIIHQIITFCFRENSSNAKQNYRFKIYNINDSASLKIYVKNSYGVFYLLSPLICNNPISISMHIHNGLMVCFNCIVFIWTLIYYDNFSGIISKTYASADILYFKIYCTNLRLIYPGHFYWLLFYVEKTTKYYVSKIYIYLTKFFLCDYYQLPKFLKLKKFIDPFIV